MLRHSLFATALLLGGAGQACAQARSDYFPHDLATATRLCVSKAGTAKVPYLDDLEASWYSQHLKAAAELPLYKDAADPAKLSTSTYRFTWLRSFHEPIIIRVEETPQGEMRLIAKRLTGKGGYEPGRVGSTVQRPLTAPEAGQFRKLLADGKVTLLEATGCDAGTDGAVWILETRIGGAYHFAHRWSPQDGAVRGIGLFLLTLTGWHVGDIY